MGCWTLRGRAVRRGLWAVFGAVTASILAATALAAPEDTSSLRAEAFEAAQWAMASDAAEALAKLSARFASGDSAVAALAEKREGLLERRAVLEQAIERTYANASSDAQALRGQYDVVLKELAATDAEIERRFPDYAELTSPRAIPVAEVQALLGPNEALLLMLSNPDATYAWGVTRDQVMWTRSESLNERALSDLVTGLRRALSRPGGASASRGASLESTSVAPASALLSVPAASYTVYDQLIRPLEPALGKVDTLIIVATGPLTSLPQAPLLTRPLAPGEAAKPGDYLIDRYALASLPAVSSLKALRCYLGDVAVRPKICPASSRRSTISAASQRLPLVGFGAPTLLGPGAEAAAAASEVTVEGLADPEQLRRLNYLDGSLVELETLSARISGAKVFTGADATETAVRVTYRSDLARARNIVFSTHGLVAGAAYSAGGGAKGLAEPGLVFTPPGKATLDDDGFLSASEAAELRLTADFVVLSACNTAAPDGRPGAEGLSGLARAFFYAGARSLLVSHWEVSDAATSSLIVQTLAAASDASVGGRAKALQRAMMQVRASPGFADPFFWAPFSLVGEPQT